MTHTLTEDEIDAMPVPACPAWCTMPHTMGWESVGSDGFPSLFHGMNVAGSAFVGISQFVKSRGEDLEIREPRIDISDSSLYDMTASDARALAAQLIVAADYLDRLTTP